MWQCQLCKQWIYPNTFHQCQQSTIPFYYYPASPYVPELLQPTLERIAKALEELAEQNKKEGLNV